MSTWRSDYTITTLSSSLSQRVNKSDLPITQAPFWFGGRGIQTLRKTCQAYITTNAPNIVGNTLRFCVGEPQTLTLLKILTDTTLYAPDTDFDVTIPMNAIDNAASVNVYSPALDVTAPMNAIDNAAGVNIYSPTQEMGIPMSAIDNAAGVNVYAPASFDLTAPMSAIDNAASVNIYSPTQEISVPMSAIDNAASVNIYAPTVTNEIPMSAIDNAASVNVYSPTSFDLTTPMNAIASTINVRTPCVLMSGSWTGTGLQIGAYALEFTSSDNSHVNVGTLGSDWGWMSGENSPGFPVTSEMQYKFSVQCWTKFSAIEGGTQAFWGTGQPKIGYGTTRAYFYDDGTSNVRQIWFEMSSGSAGASYSLSSDSAYPDDANWHHVVITFDREPGTYGFATLYVDAVAKAFSGDGYFENFVGTDEGSRTPLCFGLDGTGNPFDGVMDEFAVWNVVLDSDAVSDLYNAGDGYAAWRVSGSNLVSYFNLEDGPGNSTLANYESAISASLTGTMNNMNPGSGC